MIQLSEVLPPTPSALWTLASQMGLDQCVGGLPFDDPLNGDDQPWDFAPLQRTKQRYEDAGFKLAVLESRPPYNLIKRGLPGRDDEIDVICTLIENMGKLGIPVWCYEWMTDFNWLRTDFSTPVARRLGRHQLRPRAHAAARRRPSWARSDDDALWANLEYFLRRVVPVAERAGVKLAMHPDDPPLSPIRGVARIMRSVDNYQRLIDLVPSPVNGITLCQGNFTLMTDDLPRRHPPLRPPAEDLLRPLPRRARHAREVRGDLARRRPDRSCWSACAPTATSASTACCAPTTSRPSKATANDRPGYSSFGRLYAIGYIRGLRDAVYREPA